MAATFPTLTGDAPVVWAHRGASWNSRENTLEAAELAHQQGSDGYELDLVLTQDGQLAVFHDETLNRLTDIESRPEFADRAREVPDNDGGTQTVWFVSDFTMDELRTLEVDYARSPLDTVRDPALNPFAVDQDYVFRIPDYAEALDLLEGKPGYKVLTEVKTVANTEAETQAILDALVAEWDARGFSDDSAPVVLQSFSEPFMQAARARLDADGTDLKLVQLLDPFTFPLPVEALIPDEAALTAFLQATYGNLDGIAAFYGSYLLDQAPFADQLNPLRLDLVAAAHAAGLEALGWTFAFPPVADFDSYFLGEYVPWLFDPSLPIDPGQQYRDAVALGLDGIITDTPELALAARQQYLTAPVPLPAGAALTAGALGLLASLRRRR